MIAVEWDFVINVSFAVPKMEQKEVLINFEAFRIRYHYTQTLSYLGEFVQHESGLWHACMVRVPLILIPNLKERLPQKETEFKRIDS